MNIEIKKETRGMPYTDKFGKKQLQILEYRVILKGGKLLNVINKSGFSVEKNSDCFDYFTKKYS